MCVHTMPRKKDMCNDLREAIEKPMNPNQLGIRDVVVDETRDVVYVPWEEDRMSHLEEQLKSKMIPKYQ